MKIPQTGGPVPAGDVPGDQNKTDQTKTDDQRDSDEKSFAKVLERKRLQAEGDNAPATGGASSAVFERREFGQAPVEEAKAVSNPKLVEGLAQEIVVAAKDAKASEVTIQFNSKTLDGLKVQIRRDGNAISLQMTAQTPETARLVAAHANELTSSLELKNYTVSGVRVQGPGGRDDVYRVTRDGGRQGRGQGR